MEPCVVKHIVASNTQIDDYFNKLDQRFEMLRKDKNIEYTIKLADKHLKFQFQSEGIKNFFTTSLQYLSSDQIENADMTYLIWEDNFAALLPKEHGPKADVWIYKNSYAHLEVLVKSKSFSAINYKTKKGYLCLPSERPIPLMHQVHPFRQEFHHFCITNNQLMVHSAAIGLNDYGVMISAIGGKGKSTLALSCLLNGFQYISDDYLIIDKLKRGVVYPIYSTGFLTPESLNMLPEFNKHIITSDPNRNNKTIIDLMPFSDKFCSQINIKAILFPQVDLELSTPYISKINPAKAIAQMAFSSAVQNEEQGNTSFIMDIVKSVSWLPTYQINLCGNLDKNVNAVKNFILERMN